MKKTILLVVLLTLVAFVFPLFIEHFTTNARCKMTPRTKDY